MKFWTLWTQRKKTKNKIGIKNGNLTKRKVKRLKFDKTD